MDATSRWADGTAGRTETSSGTTTAQLYTNIRKNTDDTKVENTNDQKAQGRGPLSSAGSVPTPAVLTAGCLMRRHH